MRCVQELRGRFGKRLVVDVLRGSKGAKVLDLHLDEVASYDTVDAIGRAGQGGHRAFGRRRLPRTSLRRGQVSSQAQGQILLLLVRSPPGLCRPQMTENAVECALAERETGLANSATRRFARPRQAKDANRPCKLRIRPRFRSFLISPDGWPLGRIRSLHEEASRPARWQAGRLERLHTGAPTVVWRRAGLSRAQGSIQHAGAPVRFAKGVEGCSNESRPGAFGFPPLRCFDDRRNLGTCVNEGATVA